MRYEAEMTMRALPLPTAFSVPARLVMTLAFATRASPSERILMAHPDPAPNTIGPSEPHVAPVDQVALPPLAAPKRSRIRWVVAAAIGVLLITGGAAAYLLTRHHVTGFATPNAIGPFTRSDDQVQASQLKQNLGQSMTNAFAALYEAPNNTLIVGGGDLTVADPAARMGEMLDAMANVQSGTTITDRRAAGTGTVGGSAQCETITSTSTEVVVCGWHGNGAFVEMVFVGADRASVDGLVPTVLEAVLV
jgi:hypothetical protein